MGVHIFSRPCQPAINTNLVATEPQLGPKISFKTGETVNPDLDIRLIRPSGSFTNCKSAP